MQDLKHLYHKFLSKQCSEEEISYLMDHFLLKGEETELNELILAQLKSENHEAQDTEEVELVLNNNRKLIHEKIGEELSVRPSSLRTYLRVAAVLALITTCTWYFFNANTGPKTSGNKILASGDVGPGSTRARLTLSNGESIDLENANEGAVISKDGASYAKILQGKLTCLLQSPGNNDSAYNTITTPKGGVYQLVTPDGSKIWLNASSELKFPGSFGSGKRVVELKGEAYFEIAKDKKRPFVVKTAGQETEVLGTHFNINNYADELATTTTLFEGAVRVHQVNTSGKVLLSPGQQAVLKDRQLRVQKADESAALDWMNGKIVFKNETLKSIMRKVSRWYGVDVQIKGDIENLEFWGAVSRKNNLSSILNYLKETEDLDYSISGTNVTIFKKKL
ncbi:FecR family protein [Pedobacter caeni]|uniref:FecR family protein n=1 Tax=Pedobacter caeni TaxID=288992 RepID=A0A1M4V3U7_9SPHI|nr:FecR family protein [Pedobacter caeni]SHE63661.1 FecR family protein [Pedobacter caeni]